jgi:hypothetical protein
MSTKQRRVLVAVFWVSWVVAIAAITRLAFQMYTTSPH